MTTEVTRRVQDDIFDRIFEIKRMLPGYMTGRKKFEIPGFDYDTASHDSSTLGGNSGSAVIDIETGEVVALHFAGVYLESNFAVSMFDLASDTRVTGAGVQFSGGVPSQADFYGPIWAGADSMETVDSPNVARRRK